MKHKQLGFTLIEVTVVVAIAAILATVAVPSFHAAFERSRLKSVVDEHVSQLYLAKSEAILKNEKVYYSFRADKQCYGFKVAHPCDCDQKDAGAADMCTFVRADVNASTAALSSTFTHDGGEAFDPVRGTASGAGQMTWQSPSGFTLKTSINTLGRVGVCTPAGAGTVPGYQTAGC